MSYRFFAPAVLFLLYNLSFAVETATVDKTDREFVRKASMCSSAEVLSSQAVLKRGGLTQEERDFAQRLVTDHEKANKELQSLASKKGITVSSEVDKDMQKKIDKLSATEETKAPKEFLACQVSDHKDAIDLFEDEAKHGKDPELKEFAANTLPTLRAHLDTAKALNAKR